jgi:hypothetical protein
MTPEYTEIQRLLGAMHSASRVDQTARTPATRQAVRAAQDELFAARAAMRDDFASQYGWRHTTKGFTVDQLRNCHHPRHWTDDLWPTGSPSCPIDHAEYLRVDARPWFPVAIVSHEYGSFESSLAYAKANGLVATSLPTSWYSPERANAVLYTSPLIPLP